MNPILAIIILFVSIHLIVGTIRGVYRYKMIKKYIYDYYDKHPLEIMGKLKHNWNHATFRYTTFCISAALSVIILAIFALVQIG